MRLLAIVALLLGACTHVRHFDAGAPQPQGNGARSYLLPGAGAENDVAGMYFDLESMRIWVPAGSSGNVDVIELASGKVQRIGGFFCPSSVTQGNGMVFVGDRRSEQVCTIDPLTLERGSCTRLPIRPDGMAYVANTSELWVISAGSNQIVVLDVAIPSQMRVKAAIALEGEPAGVAVDQARGLFYTNLHDLNRTLVFDAWQHKQVSDFEAGCDGPRGLAVDTTRQLAMVGCPASVTVIDLAHGGSMLSHEAAGAGVTHLAYSETLHRLFAGAAKDGTLTEFAVTEDGKLVRVRTSPTAPGADSVVADADGNAFFADPNTARVVEVLAPR